MSLSGCFTGYPTRAVTRMRDVEHQVELSIAPIGIDYRMHNESRESE